MNMQAQVDRLLRRSEVEEMVGLKKSSIYQKMRDGNFPKPAPYRGTRHNRWRLSDIQKWLEDQLVS